MVTYKYRVPKEDSKGHLRTKRTFRIYDESQLSFMQMNMSEFDNKSLSDIDMS